jgi:hypothetical protein
LDVYNLAANPYIDSEIPFCDLKRKMARWAGKISPMPIFAANNRSGNDNSYRRTGAT